MARRIPSDIRKSRSVDQKRWRDARRSTRQGRRDRSAARRERYHVASKSEGGDRGGRAPDVLFRQRRNRRGFGRGGTFARLARRLSVTRSFQDRLAATTRIPHNAVWSSWPKPF